MYSFEQTHYSDAVIANNIVLSRLENRVTELTGYQFRWQLNVNTASIGKHVRHILDFYSCLFRGLTRQHLDYDTRARSVQLELDKNEACKSLRQSASKLSTLGTSTMSPTTDDYLTANEGTSFQANPALKVSICTTTDTAPTLVQSTLERELLFLQSHTLHHMAVIQLIMNMQEISVDPEFAFAVTTPGLVEAQR